MAKDNLSLLRPVKGERMGAEAERLARAARERPHVTEVLKLIWKGGRVSRADIAKRMDLSRSTVSNIVNQLLEVGLVAEIGAGPSRGGRRPISLQFEYDAFNILGIDMGSSHVGVALTNLGTSVLAWEERAHPVRTDPAGTRELLLEMVSACVKKASAGRLVGIGLGVPSPVDPKHPNRLSEVVLPAWRGQGLVDFLKDCFGLPVLVDNDANLGALADSWWGAARGVDDSAYLKVATGVGSGHIIGGRIYRGASGTAGEIGHLAIDPQGPACICGLRGCLATFVGTQALIERAAALLKEHPDSALAQLPITITAIEDAALGGDPLALQVIREAAHHLGIAVAGMLNLLNPSIVSIGGSLARLGEILLKPLRRAVDGRTLGSSFSAATIVASELGARDVAVGAATLVLEAALSDPAYFPLAAAQ